MKSECFLEVGIYKFGLDNFHIQDKSLIDKIIMNIWKLSCVKDIQFKSELNHIKIVLLTECEC